MRRSILWVILDRLKSWFFGYSYYIVCYFSRVICCEIIACKSHFSFLICPQKLSTSLKNWNHKIGWISSDCHYESIIIKNRSRGYTDCATQGAPIHPHVRRFQNWSSSPNQNKLSLISRNHIYIQSLWCRILKSATYHSAQVMWNGIFTRV